jgi:predicted Zn-dependent protease
MADGGVGLERLKKVLSGVVLPQAEWIGLRQVTEVTTYRGARDGKPVTNYRETSRGVMVEVLAGGSFAYAASPVIDRAGIQRAADLALAQALSLGDRGVYAFGVKERPRATGRIEFPRKVPIESVPAAEWNERLVRVCGALQVSDKVVRSTAVVRFVESETLLVSTSGSESEQRWSFVTTDFAATAQAPGVTQRRSDRGHSARSSQAGAEAFDLETALERSRVVGEQAVELLSAEECPTGTRALVLAPDQMMLQIHESIGHPLELDRILGDESNYAGVSFVRPEDFGRLRYGSSLMNVTFDPTVAGEFASYAFDDCGLPAQREYLIREGLLLRGLGGAESQARSGLPGVASTRACSWNRAPIDRMANLNLEPGESSFDEIVASVEDGVYMEANRSWSIDDRRLKFQFGCEYAKRILGGKIVGTLRNPNYRGVTVPFWNALRMVGSAQTLGVYGTPHCGKGEPNQVIRVGHASPVCLFDQVEIFGGAS